MAFKLKTQNSELKAQNFVSCVPLYLVFFIFFSLQLSAQNMAKVYGKITDTSGNAVANAGIKLEGQKQGTVSRKDGYYELTVPVGEVFQIRFSYLRKSQVIEVEALDGGEHKELNVTVSTSFEIGSADIIVKKNHPLFIEPKITDFTNIVSPSGDIADILKMLAPVSSNNELSSQYSVRGGNYDENLVYINGIEIYRPQLARSGAQEGLSTVNTDLVKNLSFSAGGFDAKYGDKLSSVLDVKYREPDSAKATIQAGFLGANAKIEGSSPNHAFTYLIGSRYHSNSFLLKSLDTKGLYNTHFIDFQSLFTYQATDKLKLSLFSYAANNSYLSRPDSLTTSFGTATEVVSLKLYMAGSDILKYNTLMSGFTTDYAINSRNRLKFITSAYQTAEIENFDILGDYYLGQIETNTASKNFGKVVSYFGAGEYFNHGRNRLNTELYNFELKGEHEQKVSDSARKLFDLIWGIKYQHEHFTDKLAEYRYSDSTDYGQPQDSDNILQMKEYISSHNNQTWGRYQGFVQNSSSILPKYAGSLTYGVRANYWDFNKELLISPRASFAFEPNFSYNRAVLEKGLPDSMFKKNLRIILATGAYHQPAFYREMRSLSGQLNPEIRAQKSWHFIASTDMNLKIKKAPFKLNASVYYKKLWDIIPYELDNVRIRYYAKNNAVGYAYGGEIQMNGEFVRDMPSWVSVAYLKTAEDLKDDFYYAKDEQDTLRRYEPGYIPRPTDQRLKFVMYFQDYLPRNPSYKAHLSFTYATPLPHGPPDFNRYKDVLRKRSYRRVDIGFSHKFYGAPATESITRKFESVWVSAEIFNLFGIDNVINYLWLEDVYGNYWATPGHLTSRRLNVRVEVKF